MHRHIVAVFLAVAFIPSFVTGQQKPERSASQRVALFKEVNGLDGWLQVTRDSRFSQAAIEKMWGSGDWAFVLSETDPLYKSFSATPPLNAELQIADAKGHVLADQPLEEPLARIEKTRPVGDKQTFLITVDYSIGMGSYAGLTTMFVKVQNAQLQWVTATNPDTGKNTPIQLSKTLKTDWKFSDARTREILVVVCRPDFDSQASFTIRYLKYRKDEQKGWLVYDRSEKGIWESDEPFPPRTKFP